ncbi:MAG TPA: hypothetical protein VKM55_23725 [Candidatus Lokiarchaeia archaeon]|nr:hypothetical protein [Candidatus Lokiarchaeia archaeon]
MAKPQLFFSQILVTSKSQLVVERVDAARLKQPKYAVSFIILANIFWGIIPLFAIPIFRGADPVISGATNEFASLIVVFIRFLFAGVIMLSIVVFQLICNSARSRQKEPGKLEYFQTSWQDIKKYLFSRNKNFYNAHRLWYIFIIALFGVTLNVATYFIGLNELPVAILLMGSPGGFIILVSVYDVAKGKEKLSYFNAIYIFLLFLSLILIVIAQEGGSEDLSKKDLTIGFICLLLNIVCLFINFAYMGRDTYAQSETIVRKSRAGNYRMMRTLTKLTVYFLFGALGTIIAVPICLILPIPYLNELGTEFVTRIGFFFTGLYFWQLAVLVVVCTVGPNLCVFLASAWWDNESQFTFQSWNSILSLIDNMTSIIVSFLAGFSKVDPLFLTLTVIVLGVAILLRFVHEREAKINAIIYLKIKEGTLKSTLQFLHNIHEIRKFFYITGRADILVKATFGSTREFYTFLTRVTYEKDIKIIWDNISFVEDIESNL